MKTKLNLIFVIIVSISFFLTIIISSTSAKSKPIQSDIERGKYIPQSIVKIKTLRNLPIPSSNTDYAFYQSIRNISNIVIGKFKSGERVITLIQDKNSDGKVDIVVHLFIDLNRINRESNPSKYCSAEKFAKYKEDIINGRIEEITPNPEGISYMKSLLNYPSNIKKARHGFRISRTDIDEPTQERVSYFFSFKEISGADIVFDIKYYYRGTARISPAINYGVYCKESKDPFAIELTKKTLKEIMQFYYN